MKFTQIVACHKSHMNECDRTSETDFIMFTEDGFPYCPEHYPRRKMTNLGTRYKLPKSYRKKYTRRVQVEKKA